MRLHLEMQAERNRAGGMNADEARYAALRQFGNVAIVQERVREGRGWGWVEQAVQDFRYAFRQLGRSPVFAIVAVATLAFGIGASTVFFSVVNAVFLRTLPVGDPAGLHLFAVEGPGGSGDQPRAVPRGRDHSVIRGDAGLPGAGA